MDSRCTWKRPTAAALVAVVMLPAAVPDESVAGPADSSSRAAAEREAPDDVRTAFVWRDVEGTEHRPFDAERAAVVLIFALPDCPIVNAYMPEFNRLQDDYGRRGVSLFVVHVDPDLTEAAARHHAREYRLEVPVVLDTRHEWVRRAGATRAPEAAVFSPAGNLLYRGRIDDRYVGFGQRRPRATSHDLRDALDAVVAGRPVPRPRTEVVGCYVPDRPQ